VSGSIRSCARWAWSTASSTVRASSPVASSNASRVPRALAARPEIIFGDEPTGNLDSRSSGEVLGILRQCVDDLDQTVVIVTPRPSRRELRRPGDLPGPTAGSWTNCAHPPPTPCSNRMKSLES